MKQILALISLSLVATFLFAQQKKAATFTAVKYQSINPDPFKTLPVTHLGLDYYYAEQLGTGERLWYEIVIAGEKISLHFHAKGTKNLQPTEYEYEGKLTTATVKNLQAAYNKARLVQKIKGVPVTDENYTTKEILITKSYDVLIGGGWYYSNGPGKDQQKQIKAQKEKTNNLLGNPEMLIAEMKKSFPNLAELMKKAHK